jgi:hypothetical protein
MSGNSSVGTSGVYEAGDQRNYAKGEDPNQPDRFHEGKEHSHLAQDSSKSIYQPQFLTFAPAYAVCYPAPPRHSFYLLPNTNIATEDERTIANKLAREEKREAEADKEDPETAKLHKDATLPARSHGNEPSKGAKIDQQLKEEEEEELRRKGKA